MSAPRTARPEDYRACAERGLTQTEAARELGVSRSAVCLAARRHGLKFRSTRAAPVEDFAREYNAGRTHKEIMAIFGCGRETVCRRIAHARELGLIHAPRRNADQVDAPPRPRTSRRDVTYEGIMALKAAGKTQAQIARHYNCSEKLVGNRLGDGPPLERPKPRVPVVQPGMSALERDLVRAGGYRDLAAIAEKHGLTFAQVQQRWHRVRMAA